MNQPTSPSSEPNRRRVPPNGRHARRSSKIRLARKRPRRKKTISQRPPNKSRPSPLPRKLLKSRTKLMKLTRLSIIVRIFTPRRRCLQLKNLTMISILSPMDSKSMINSNLMKKKSLMSRNLNQYLQLKMLQRKQRIRNFRSLRRRRKLRPKQPLIRRRLMLRLLLRKKPRKKRRRLKSLRILSKLQEMILSIRRISKLGSILRSISLTTHSLMMQHQRRKKKLSQKQNRTCHKLKLLSQIK